MPNVAFHTLGCKVNFYETEAIWNIFKNRGYQQVHFDDEADVYVINTCTVTNTGDKKSRQVIRRAVRKNPNAVVAVTGCYAQTSPTEVLKIPGVDVVIGTQGREKLLDYVEEAKQSRMPVNAVGNIMKQKEFEELSVPSFSEKRRAFLKIQEGCNNFCTFCIIPWTRGLSRSRKPEKVLSDARLLVENGYKEIVLTGIHTGGYGEDLEDYSLAKLLGDLAAIEGLHRIRISSIEASQITEEMIDVFRNNPKMCRHLHIPLQSGDDMVLARMHRKYTTVQFKEKVERIKEALPDVAITTDVIVGFPGETEEMFQNTHRFIEEIGFAELHVFPYSKRTGTPAARFTDQVPEEVKKDRVDRLLALNRQLTFQYARRFEGEVLEVIPEGYLHDDPSSGLLIGYSDNYLRIAFAGSREEFGKVCRVRLDRAEEEVCQGSFARLVKPVSA